MKTRPLIIDAESIAAGSGPSISVQRWTARKLVLPLLDSALRLGGDDSASSEAAQIMRESTSSPSLTEIERLNAVLETAGADLDKLRTSRDESDRIGYERLCEISHLEVEVKRLKALNDISDAWIFRRDAIIRELRTELQTLQDQNRDRNTRVAELVAELSERQTLCAN